MTCLNSFRLLAALLFAAQQIISEFDETDNTDAEKEEAAPALRLLSFTDEQGVLADWYLHLLKQFG